MVRISGRCIQTDTDFEFPTRIFRAHRFRKFARGPLQRHSLRTSRHSEHCSKVNRRISLIQRIQFESVGGIFLVAMGACCSRPRIFRCSRWFSFDSESFCTGLSGLLLLDFPATIFAYSGFFPRLTNVADMIAIGFACTAVGCLSWFAGRALRYALARRARSHSPGVLPG